MSLSEYFEQHEEQAFVAKALATAVAIIVLKNYLCWFIPLFLLISPLVFLIGIRMHAATAGVSATELLKEHITFLPVMRTEKERRLEVKPWVTYSLIFVNVLVFYGFELNAPPNFIGDNLIFLPNRPDLFNVPLSAFTSMFLHGSGGHLWGNMTFLWVVGTAVERRVGRMKFFRLYLLTGLIGGLVYLLIEFVFAGKAGHALGASGAIAGIMGIFAVRCYFKTMIFPLPILGIFSLILPISLKIRLNSLMVMALFFLADLSGGIDQITGTSQSGVAHWAHLGGMISGMLMAGYLKLGDAAVEERHLDIGIKAAGETVGFGGGERSLQIVLERSPDNVEALLGMARLKTKFTNNLEGKELYEKVLRLMLVGAPTEVVAVFSEYKGKFLTVPSDWKLVAGLAEALRRAGEHELSIFCLERLVDMPEATGQLREKALFQLATLLHFTSCFEAAASCFARFVAEYPTSLLADKAREKAGGEVHIAPGGAAAAAEKAPARRCPACGFTMAIRTATTGPRRGKEFWVCGNYPTCRTSFPVSEAGEAFEHRSAALERAPESYRLVCDGHMPFTSDPAETRVNVARLLRCGPEQVDRLLCGKKTVLKRGLDRAAALKLKEAFDATGACCLIENEEQRDAAAAFQGAQPSLQKAPQGAPPRLQVAAQKSATPSPSGTIECPKCGHQQEKEEYCVKCGVYFSKLAMLAERELLPQEQGRVKAAGRSVS